MLKQLKILLSEFQDGNDGKLIKAQIRSLLKTMLEKHIITLDNANIIEDSIRTG